MLMNTKKVWVGVPVKVSIERKNRTQTIKTKKAEFPNLIERHNTQLLWKYKSQK